jgi:hypothetical protein
MARTAAVVGTATAVSNRVSRRQSNRWAQQDAQQYAPPPPDDPYAQQAPPPPPAPVAVSQADTIEQLKQLGGLHEQGVLTDEEFAVQKSKLLNA